MCCPWRWGRRVAPGRISANKTVRSQADGGRLVLRAAFCGPARRRLRSILALPGRRLEMAPPLLSTIGCCLSDSRVRPIPPANGGCGASGAGQWLARREESGGRGRAGDGGGREAAARWAPGAGLPAGLGRREPCPGRALAGAAGSSAPRSPSAGAVAAVVALPSVPVAMGTPPPGTRPRPGRRPQGRGGGSGGPRPGLAPEPGRWVSVSLAGSAELGARRSGAGGAAAARQLRGAAPEDAG